MANLSTAEKRKWREFHKVGDKMMSLVMRAGRLFRQAEDLLLQDLKRVHANGDKEMLEMSLSRLATFHQIEGRTHKSEQYLRERERLFPDSLEAKLASARWFGYTMRRYDFALRKLREIRLPKNPAQSDYDTLYNALNLKGVSLLYTGQRARALAAMRELAEFTRKNLDKILFFFDLTFVEMMIERRLALGACRDYLQTLRKREQVRHDMKKTVVLLRRVNKLLKK
jgi:tetratricopeptide (TPR) repeat protein